MYHESHNLLNLIKSIHRPKENCENCSGNMKTHDDVIKWKHFPRNWPFVRGIHPSPVNSPHKGQWRGALMFSLICVWTNDWVNNHEAGDLRRYRTHYDVIVMIYLFWDQRRQRDEVPISPTFLMLIKSILMKYLDKNNLTRIKFLHKIVSLVKQTEK